MSERSVVLGAVAQLGAQAWPQVSVERALEFVEHYFKYVDDTDLVNRPPTELASLIVAHANLARVRRPGETKIEIHQPASPGDSTVVLIVCDDRVFIVDSVIMALLDLGWNVRNLYHPQYQVMREDDQIVDMVHRADHVAEAIPESWVCCEVFPPLGCSSADLSDALLARLTDILADGEAVVADFAPMVDRMAEAAALLIAQGEDPDDEGGPVGLLRWLPQDNFTFLGFARFAREGDLLVPVPGTGLGIYRDERGLGAEPATKKELLSLGKDPARSTVHRSSYLDRLSVREVVDGEVRTELRFTGLFTSAAYNRSVDDIPFLASKARAVLERSAYDPQAYGAKAIAAVLAAYPRDELLQASVDDLYEVAIRASRFNERRRVRLFVREAGRFVNALVYFPRDRYNTEVRERMERSLMAAYGASSVEHQARVGQSALARLYFVLALDADAEHEAVDLEGLEAELEAATHTWDDGFIALVDDFASEERGIEFSQGYREDFTPEEGVADLRIFNELRDEWGDYRMEAGPDGTHRLKVYLVDGDLTLTKVLPQLAALGVEVLDERPYEIELRGQRAMLFEFSLRPHGFQILPTDQQRFVDAFAAAHRGQVEADSFSALVTKAGMTWRSTAILRSIARYLRQTGAPFSQTYIARALVANPTIAGDLYRMFRAKFDPEQVDREAAVTRVRERLVLALDDISSLDYDRILRGYLAVIEACVRTNAYVTDGPFAPGSRDALALKLHPGQLSFAPEPKPDIEVFVYSPLVEGVHLRFGKVARGGLRWSDRAEDYRTEVLGLVKAQMVKNTVIVPTGAKGGFYAKQLPDPGMREAWREAGIEAYRGFITALLSITDNIVGGATITPAGVVPADDPDPYLVVAADKGTATFSDIANAISVESGFWLGDAFASGGSNGYDHKAMGITARGAWESVKRHFLEIGVDCQTEDFTCVGIGDMSGDVFGNGMLLSQHIRLVGAFNHRHIFLDPDPDAATSFVERKRLFELPGSAWSDYDPSLISDGGGVFDRSAKSVPISVRAAARIGIEPGELTPDELISALLRAPVDLIYNGGIGTYFKGSSETHAQVGDKANDAVRVNGAEVRARIVGEGGNLGWTQAGRVEYAQRGGSINTDFIDNSAGVDTSDHEVNIKILLAGPQARGELSTAEQGELLRSMTNDVAEHVLAHNVDQNLALANARASASGYVGIHEGWMCRLTAEGYLDRELEGLPPSAELLLRNERGESLYSPELASLLAWTKIYLADKILASDLPDDPYVAGRLIEYFPKVLRTRFADDIQAHQLRREIITTLAVNRFVNSQGISAYYLLSESSGATPAEIFRAQLASRSIFSAGRFEIATRSAGLDAAAETDLRLELRGLVERGTRWLLQNRPRLVITDAIAELSDDVHRLLAGLRATLTPAGAQRYDERVERFGLVALGERPELIAVIAGAPVADRALSIVAIAAEVGVDPLIVAEGAFALSEELGLDALQERVSALPRFDRWDSMARSALLGDLAGLRDELVTRLAQSGLSAAQWMESLPRVTDVASTVREVTADEPDLAKASVALRAIRGMLS